LKRLDLLIHDDRWRRIPRLGARLEKTAVITLAHLPKILRFPCTMTVMLTADAAIRQLNYDFRGIDKPTNVLSFPQFEPRELTKKGRSKGASHLGDIVISYQYVVAEAKKDHKILINHLTHLLIHGILHLFGYDHLSAADAARMERLEKKVMAALGLPDPYLSQ
jgi:probable rRNA maturation factor